LEQNAPSLLNRLAAAVKGEVTTETLEAYRRAGSVVYELLVEVETRRTQASAQGGHPWSFDPALRAQLLCTWNAFVLQLLGDQFLDADFTHDPLTRGFVPAVTAQQTQAVYAEVEQWLTMARQAAINPNYRLGTTSPATLPEWAEADPCPRPHLAAMLGALRAVREHADTAMALFESEAIPAEHQGVVERLRQLHARAGSKADYAERLNGEKVSAELHEQIEQHAQQALEDLFLLGQLLAEPALISHRTLPGGAQPAKGTRPPSKKRRR
jgi:hypothetical protein